MWVMPASFSLGGRGWIWSLNEPGKTYGQNVLEPKPSNFSSSRGRASAAVWGGAHAGAASPTPATGPPSLPPSPLGMRSSETRNQTCLQE